MTNALYIILAIVVFGVIVFFHELGHFLAARTCGIAVDEFSIGFGPSLISKKRKNTLYSIRLLPLGGFCRFVGEDDDSDAEGAFNKQSVFKRMIVTFSGPFMNFVLAYIATVVYLMAIGVVFNAPVVYDVMEGTNAQLAGLRSGDVIVSIDGEEISFDYEGHLRISEIISENEPDEPMTFTIQRNDETFDVDIAAQPVEGGVQIGIYLGGYYYRYNLPDALGQSFSAVWNVLTVMLDALRNMFTTGEGIEDTAGPVGAITMMSTQMQQGMDMTLYMIILISMNLGIINLFPVPGLDGGRLLFQVVEAVRRKPIKPEHEGWIHAGGIIALLGLMVLLTYRDIARLITGGVGGRGRSKGGYVYNGRRTLAKCNGCRVKGLLW
ncbi:MAG: M50 family metallopeptidase [Clostridia bacterium]|nr:M50 family metallopeptidase [Clostridia bacterium]